MRRWYWCPECGGLNGNHHGLCPEGPVGGDDDEEPEEAEEALEEPCDDDFETETP